ncbi:hypothetical protein ES703_12426 [subsurface metagenome]|nr:hypothetical protein [bacterium]
MRNKKILIIAAVAVMLVGATSAYAYHEVWDGWFNSGYLILSDVETEQYFEYVEGEGILEDLTAGDIDTFFIAAISVLTFTCIETGDTIKLWAAPASGSKPTGQSGIKEVNEGAAWSGMAILRRSGLPPDTFDVEGTWDTTSEAGDCFNYLPGKPPNYSAHWEISNSEPEGLTGAGGSAGD